MRSIVTLLRLLAAIGLAAAAFAACAHDIPGDVRVQAFVKPEGSRLHLLIRVPLAAMNEVDLPLHGPGYLDLARADAALRTAAELWFADNLVLQEDGRTLPRPVIVATRVSLASDRSFASWGTALAHLHAPPIAPGTELYWKQQHFDLLLDYPIASEHAAFAIAPRLERLGLRVVTSLVFLPPGGEARAFEFHGDPGLVQLDPRWHQAALRFVALGFEHILDGRDHLLFLAALVIPLRRLRPLLVVATAFTLAHSLTLAAAALGWALQALWFPPLVETLIATSIVAMALENLFGTSARRRWIAAFAFGLVHGFGFAFALGETMQFAGSHLATALLAFNVGVELGQIAVLLVGVPLLAALLRAVPERAGVIVLSALVAHTGWHWMIDRGSELAKFPWPVLDAAAAVALLRWAMALLVLGVLVWWLDRPVRRWMGADAAR
ncbi:MAG: HupE/UreJ family protein [Burkholderiaceae bacterium]